LRLRPPGGQRQRREARSAARGEDSSPVEARGVLIGVILVIHSCDSFLK